MRGVKERKGKMMKERRENSLRKSSQAPGNSEIILRLSVVSPWLGSLFIAAEVDFGPS